MDASRAQGVAKQPEHLHSGSSYKRLEKGTFAKLWRDDGQVVRLTASELALYIEGCTLVGKHALSPIALERKSLVSDRAM
jgi:transposase